MIFEHAKIIKLSKQRKKYFVGNAVETDENPSQNVEMTMTTHYVPMKNHPKFFCLIDIRQRGDGFSSVSTQEFRIFSP